MKRLVSFISVFGIVFFIATLLGIGSTRETAESTTAFTKVVPTEPVTFEPVAPTPVQQVKSIKHLDLSAKNVIEIYGPIDGSVLLKAKEILRLGKGKEPIYILIDSPGGSVLDGAQLVSAMEASKVPVITICTGVCASMGFIIHQYGTERLMVDRSLLMAHPATAGVQGSLQQMQSRLSMLTSFVNKLDSYIAKRAGLDVKKFHEMSVSELWLDAEDATQLKFADGIVSVTVQESLKLFNTPTTSTNSIRDKINFRWSL